MEHESIDPGPYYYSGNTEILRCAQDGRSGTPRGQIMRSMSMTGAQGTKGPTGDASGISGGTNAAAIAEHAAYVDAATEGDLTFSYNDSNQSIPTPPAVALALSGFDFANLLSDLFSGSPGPTYRQQLMELRATQGGRHPIYTRINGISNTLIVDQNPVLVFGRNGVPSFYQPLVKDPSESESVAEAEKGLGLLAWYSHLVHPAELLIANDWALVSGVALAYAGGAEILAACFNPTPVEPVTCAAGAVAGFEIAGVGASLIAEAAYGFVKVTLPAIENDWGLP